ncbi:tyrosine-type recombinase/integrase [Pseudarthrobacter sp. HLT3-5]|uniref:tyrosine-type recombinase/integrase n=1 Tax=Pseudarthrobacter cellobiosi TaxID=2953654 RepID=UPI00208E8346|nr:tyrosine-type recombinase/integrase [Pseudarthrobacter sp. HLT3-5]MCO4273294.1 tyrosine-type recombinase/integrase [Pseudarthrobacter sp. HLT3-5]
MKIPIGELISKADTEIVRLNQAPSTLMQYRWAWHRFEVFCSDQRMTEFTDEALAAYLQFLATERTEGRFKEWKYKILRKTALVLSEVDQTGTYGWKLSKHASPNDRLNHVFRPLQEHFQAWLSRRGLAQDTQELYATVARRALASWQGQGITDLGKLTGADVASALVFLAKSYRPGSMRTVLTAVRVLCRFLEETRGCSGLARAVPRIVSRRVRHVSVLPAEQIEMLVASPDPGKVVGRRDRAMLLLGARTGLRPVDIVALRLRNIDWRDGRIILVQHKTGALLVLPLLADVGEAIADYLLHDRPALADDDHVFLRAHVPHVALGPSNGLHYVSSRAFGRTGIASPPEAGQGFRVLRASLAPRMLEGDTPLPVIAGALGHRGISSAKHYLAADEERMRECCLDFAGIEPRGSLS